MKEKAIEAWTNAIPVMRSLRELGYAVAVFNPDELEGFDPDEIECVMIEAGWNRIDCLKDFMRWG